MKSTPRLRPINPGDHLTFRSINHEAILAFGLQSNAGAPFGGGLDGGRIRRLGRRLCRDPQRQFCNRWVLGCQDSVGELTFDSFRFCPERSAQGDSLAQLCDRSG